MSKELVKETTGIPDKCPKGCVWPEKLIFGRDHSLF